MLGGGSSSSGSGGSGGGGGGNNKLCLLSMNGVAVYGWNMPSMDGGPIGGKLTATRCME